MQMNNSQCLVFMHSSEKQNHTFSGSKKNCVKATAPVRGAVRGCGEKRSANETNREYVSSYSEKMTSAEHARYISGAFITLLESRWFFCFWERDVLGKVLYAQDICFC